MNDEIIGYLAMFANVILFSLAPVFYKSVNYNIINNLTVSAIALCLFAVIYLIYKHFTDKSYFKINNTNLLRPSCL